MQGSYSRNSYVVSNEIEVLLSFVLPDGQRGLL